MNLFLSSILTGTEKLRLLEVDQQHCSDYGPKIDNLASLSKHEIVAFHLFIRNVLLN